MPTLSGLAPAKINLGLRILNRRPDGYHELRTIFQSISLADRLMIQYSGRGQGEVTISCNVPELAGEDNLAVRAARSFLSAGRLQGRVSITLEKRIPPGAGLGGGSSDAAAVLLALRRLVGERPPSERLRELAASLGSDVPYFLTGGTAVGLDRGVEVYPLPDIPRRWLVLLLPGIPVSTKEAYGQLRKTRPRLTAADREHIINGFCASVFTPEGGGALDLAQLPPNDFEKVVFQQFPDLQKWKEQLLEHRASPAMLSGSGSALFGVFPDAQVAGQVCRSLRGFPGKIHIVKTLGRRSYERIWRRYAV